MPKKPLFFRILHICLQFTAIFKYIKKYRDIYNVNHALGHMCQHVSIVSMSACQHVSMLACWHVGTLGMSACWHVGVGWQRELGASKEEGMKAAAILAVDLWV